jgi:hypothetical protein
MTAADKFTWSTYDTLLRLDFVSFAQRCFRELSPRTQFAMNWHIEIIAAKLMAVRAGKIRRLIINLPPRYLKSMLASVAFPAWCLGHDPAAQILCVSYAQELADKLSRDCRRILASDWYRRIFPTRLSPERQAVPEFETTEQGCRLATSVGGVLTAHGLETGPQRFCGSHDLVDGLSGLNNGLVLDSSSREIRHLNLAIRGAYI